MSPDFMNELERAATLLAQNRPVVALTGAGLSIASGIPAFRGAQGLWARYDPMEYAEINGFKRDPAKAWEMLKELDALVATARPNPAHVALARLERLGVLSGVITQNIDGLHQLAGSHQVVEFHGSGRTLHCLDCGRKQDRAALAQPVPRCACGGLIKPDVVFYGEAIPTRALSAALELCRRAGVMIVSGTSAVVAPASQLPWLIKEQGGLVIEIQPEPTVLTEQITDLFIPLDAGQALPELARLVESRLEPTA